MGKRVVNSTYVVCDHGANAPELIASFTNPSDAKLCAQNQNAMERDVWVYHMIGEDCLKSYMYRDGYIVESVNGGVW